MTTNFFYNDITELGAGAARRHRLGGGGVRGDVGLNVALGNRIDRCQCYRMNQGELRCACSSMAPCTERRMRTRSAAVEAAKL